MRIFLFWILVASAHLSFAQKTSTTQPKPKQSDSKEKEYMTVDEYERKHKGDVPEVFTIVEEMPEFPGGNDSMNKFIQRTIKYPEKARQANIGGKCFVKFIVLSDGSINDAKVEKGVPECAECDAEALRVVQLMPKWKPGKMSGRAVDVYYILPFKFQP